MVENWEFTFLSFFEIKLKIKNPSRPINEPPVTPKHNPIEIFPTIKPYTATMLIPNDIPMSKAKIAIDFLLVFIGFFI